LPADCHDVRFSEDAQQVVLAQDFYEIGEGIAVTVSAGTKERTRGGGSQRNTQKQGRGATACEREWIKPTGIIAKDGNTIGGAEVNPQILFGLLGNLGELHLEHCPATARDFEEVINFPVRRGHLDKLLGR